LIKALGHRPGFESEDITPETRLHVVAETYFEQLERAVNDGLRSPNTLRVYRSIWATEISKAVGQLRVRECTTSRLNAYLVSARDRLKPSYRLTVKALLTNVLALAVRRGALSVNPVREVESIARTDHKEVKALSAEQVGVWLKHLATDEIAVRYSLLDFSLLMLATGARISEALAVLIEDVDLIAGTVALDFRIIRVTGQGLVRVSRRGRKGAPTLLHLPSWAVAMVDRRAAELGRVTGPLFPGVKGIYRDPSNVGAAVAAVREAAGVDFLTSHTLRKTVATLLDEAGVHIKDIAEYLTHTNTTTAQKYYVARRPVGEQGARALEALGLVVPGSGHSEDFL
jgi:integrase